MNFVLDTNAVSETEKPRPNPGFISWFDAQDPAHLFITTISVGEVWNGFHSLEPNHRDYNRIKIIATTSVYKDAFQMAGTLGAHAAIRKPPEGKPLPERDWLGTVRRLIGDASREQPSKADPTNDTGKQPEP